MSAWYDAKTKQEIVSIKLFEKLEVSFALCLAAKMCPRMLCKFNYLQLLKSDFLDCVMGLFKKGDYLSYSVFFWQS